VTQALNRYRAQLREFKFVLFEQLGLGDVLGKPPYAAWGRAEVEMVVEELDRFVREVLGPLNPVGDRVGCTIVDGQVVTPPGYKEAWTKLYEGGWKTIAVPEEHGGQGAPQTLHAVVEEFLSGANTAFTMYPGLTAGAAELVSVFGTPSQKERFLGNMTSGKWSGTMCLTEPQAGSDVGAATTSARKLPDGTYAIKGTKIYISCGDHDLAENIIHMVLARIDGAPPGTKGLSLFIVPKKRVDANGTTSGGNDVVTASIEHKLGINGSATAVLQFGENDGCVGELVGGIEHSGMMQMFRMMNGARIGVALQGLAIASTAYLNAVDYAKERKQGPHYTHFKDANAPRVPIIEHPDVRRMLLDMKARVEGIRVLILKLALHQDKVTQLRGKDDDKAAYHQGQVDLLVPIVKAYASDQAFRVCETALQTYGGAGYLKDHPVEQYLRDSKIFSIYEGTNHIQAMDLVGRKLPQGGGANFRAFLADVGTFVAANASHPAIGPETAALAQSAEALSMVAGHFLAWLSERKMGLVPLAANRFLEMMAETAVGWLLLDGARIAHAALANLSADDPDHDFYAGKLKAGLYFARNVLPMAYAKAKVLAAEDTTALDMADSSF
jgi:hypothetical protein